MNNIFAPIQAPSTEATPLLRLKYLLELSRRNQAGFARLLGVEPSTLSRVLTGRQPITDSFINKVVVNVGVSKEWLANGEGVPFPKNESEGPANIAETSVEIAAAPKGAAVYDIDVTAGCMPLARSFTTDRIIGYLDLPYLNPEFPVVRVSGDSMSPRIPHGSLISIRQVGLNTIMWGAIYLVELEDYRLIKYVRRHPSNPDIIILHSENPEFEDMEVAKNHIIKLFLVESVINFQTLI